MCKVMAGLNWQESDKIVFEIQNEGQKQLRYASIKENNKNKVN